MSFPLPNTGLPAFDGLIAGDLWSQWAADGRVFPVENLREAVRYVRMKPGTSCRMTVFGDLEGRADEPPCGFLLHLYPDADRAGLAFEKEMTRHHVAGGSGSEPFLSTDPPVIAIPFPNDPDIPDLRHAYLPDRFRRTLAEILVDYPEDQWRVQRQLVKSRLLAYKPGRRAVFRLKVKLRRRDGDEKVRVYLHTKFETPRTVERSYQNLQAIHAALPDSGLWRVPAPRGFVDGRSFIASQWVDAPPLTRMICERHPDLSEALRRTGAATAALHGLEVRLDHCPSPVEEAESLVALARDLSALLPDDGDRIHESADRLVCLLSRLSLVPSAIVHGDLHPGQVLVDGAAPVFVDFDRAGRGYAALDVGSFLANLWELGGGEDLRDSYLAGYGEAGQEPLDDELLRITTAVALFRRSAFPFRDLRDDWPAATRKHLAQVEALLKGLDL